ncbi:helix-turn-helix transcriptional regulator [Massilia sp. R2A-15]|uniref:helix-turn-helix domain-containing protein n=1 Tax=Massilia sp. R2A-15 TaxID=3064278 RepID=UPI0027336CC0|nr:helix-turn-helix transcriptional regulator [Massilia sp. R2A-15]WLI90807.1 helix-turn-helix transcriptional regulator [Massilia sp. R2A-15]
MSASAATLGRSFGIGVRRLREERCWSQEQLAEQAGLNRSYVGEIERGDVSVSLCTVAKLADAFGLAPSALVGRGESIAVA